MVRLLLPMTLVVTLTGCIIYSEEVVYRDHSILEYEDALHGSSDTRPSDEGASGGQDTTDDGPSSDADTPAVMTPNLASPGDVLIAELQATGELDLSDATDFEFYGPAMIEVLAHAEKDEATALLTLRVPLDARSGSNDLLISFDDGSALYIEAMFTVRSADADGSDDNGTTHEDTAAEMDDPCP